MHIFHYMFKAQRMKEDGLFKNQAKLGGLFIEWPDAGGLFEALKPEDIPRKIPTFLALEEKLFSRPTYKSLYVFITKPPKGSK